MDFGGWKTKKTRSRWLIEPKKMEKLQKKLKKVKKWSKTREKEK